MSLGLGEGLAIAGGAVQFASAVTVIIKSISAADFTVASLPRVRESLQSLYSYLDAVAATYQETVHQIGGARGRKHADEIRRRMRACLGPCEAIREIAIAVKTARTSRRVAGYFAGDDLERYRRELDRAVGELGWYLGVVSEDHRVMGRSSGGVDNGNEDPNFSKGDEDEESRLSGWGYANTVFSFPFGSRTL